VLEGDLLEDRVDDMRVDVSHVININFLCENKESKINTKDLLALISRKVERSVKENP